MKEIASRGNDKGFFANKANKFDSNDFYGIVIILADLYTVDVSTINYHLGQIFSTGELKEEAVIRKFPITAADGKDYDTLIYNLDAIISCHEGQVSDIYMM